MANAVHILGGMNGQTGSTDHIVVRAEKFRKETVEALTRLERDLKHLKHPLAQDKPAHLASTEPELQNRARANESPPIAHRG